MAQLTRLHLAGWKSIRDTALEFRRLNVMIGANGSGKSNLIGFFKLVNEMIGGRLHEQVGKLGGAVSLLYFGPRRTKAIEVCFRFDDEQGRSDYSLRLSLILNSLTIAEQRVEVYPSGVRRPQQSDFGEGQGSGPKQPGEEDGSREKFIRGFLARCRVFHFHDTSPEAAMRRDCFLDANRFLYSDGGNLAAMLYLYRQRYPTVYHRILAAVRQITPNFDDFVLEPLRLNPRNVQLDWRSKGSEYEFGPHQLSDGTLRVIALCTLLLQPDEDLPAMILLDEPELGLHPSALAILADLMKLASERCQLLVATQSATLIDHFDAGDIITVDQRDGTSSFQRLDAESLKQWLEEYTVGELWEKNVIGGGPYG